MGLAFCCEVGFVAFADEVDHAAAGDPADLADGLEGEALVSELVGTQAELRGVLLGFDLFDRVEHGIGSAVCQELLARRVGHPACFDGFGYQSLCFGQ
jgi:hypothetical protein